MIVWCFNKLKPRNKVDFVCAVIIFVQGDKECQEAVYISCGHCPKKIPRGKGIRALGFKEGDIKTEA